MDAAPWAFAVVFVAELGDKTQLVALGLATRYRLGVVLVGIGLAYAVTQGLAALLGGALGAALPTTAIGVGAAVLFFAFAVWTLLESEEGEPGDDAEEATSESTPEAGTHAATEAGSDRGLASTTDPGGGASDEVAEVAEVASEVEAVARRTGRSAFGIVLGIVGAMVLAEIGDKSMLATATIAAERGALGAWVGATLGITASGALAVFVGRYLGARIPERATRLVAAGLFALFGVLLLVETLT